MAMRRVAPAAARVAAARLRAARAGERWCGGMRQSGGQHANAPVVNLPDGAKADYDMQREFWDDFAEVYDDSYYGYWSMKAHDQLIELARVKPGMKVLDVGSGTGRLAVELAKRGAEVTALDWSEGMVEVSAERVTEAEKTDPTLEHAPLKVDLIEADIEHAALPQDRYDVIICHDVLPYLPSLRPALDAMYAALAPYGTCLVTSLGTVDENPCLAACYTVMENSTTMAHSSYFAKSTAEYELSSTAYSVNPAHSLGRPQRLMDEVVAAGFAHSLLERKKYETSFSDVALFNLADDSYRFGGQQWGTMDADDVAKRSGLHMSLFQGVLTKLTETHHRIRQRRRPVFCTFNIVSATKLRNP
eukprot:TRINITY_DN11865_c0_g2_i1.p1 TRINITY_DN11865_c0_g2~~TRINITY_DN11865_c0_g2_i1.p1  ORF type:complete len:360 (+),score=70.08 TRINITY_DN11865_c0_g2_i1:39-1118(+)